MGKYIKINNEKIKINENTNKTCNMCGMYSIIQIKNTKTHICETCLQIGLNDINILIVKNGEIHSKKK
jgi:hypothetical protein